MDSPQLAVELARLNHPDGQADPRFQMIDTVIGHLQAGRREDAAWVYQWDRDKLELYGQDIRRLLDSELPHPMSEL